VSGIINFAKLKLLRYGRTGGGNLVKGKDTSFIPPRRGGGLLRLSRAFSVTLTGRFGMATVRMGAEGRW
jgi:hypothetical protein